jgi:hypothetical protein
MMLKTKTPAQACASTRVEAIMLPPLARTRRAADAVSFTNVRGDETTREPTER